MKTIFYVGSGSPVAGDNISVTPLAPPGIVPGDLVLISAGIRGGTAKVRAPSGWKSLVQHENLSLLARIWQPSDTFPLVTFQGGAAGDTTLATAHAFRFTNPDVDLMLQGSSSLTNAAAQDVDIPALSILDPGCLVINLAIKQDDFSSASRSGFGISSQNPSTAGSDAGTAFLAKVQTAPVNEPAGTITVTGGAAALSWSIVVAIRPYVTTWTNISGADSPCQFTERFNEVSEAACAAFVDIESRMAALTNTPLARISVNSTTPVVDTVFSYTTVDIDPSGIVDIISDPDSISLTPIGVWMTGIGINVTFTGSEGSAIQFGDSARGQYHTTVRDLNTTNNPPGGGGVGTASVIMESGPTPHRISPQVLSTGSPIVSIKSSELYVFRMSD